MDSTRGEPVTLEGRMAAAYRAGHAAGQAGRRVITNPHDPRSSDPVQRVLAKMWVRGHSEGNPMPPAPTTSRRD